MSYKMEVSHVWRVDAARLQRGAVHVGHWCTLLYGVQYDILTA